MSSNLARDSRPETFAEVVGQRQAVKILSNLIRSGRVGRHIVLYGSVGSGKTTLARIYANALNCTAPSTDGSPCLNCGGCSPGKKDPVFFHEYDTPGRGDLDAVKQWLETTALEPPAGGWRVIFFDEAHALKEDASDLLLKRLENRTSRIVYLFATTEPGRLREALRSRLLPLQVRPIDPADSVRLLKSVAGAKGLDCDDGVIELLAGLKGGYPRDLLNGLEEIDHLKPITVAEVRQLFDVDHVDVLVDYLKALAALDFAGAMSVIANWQETGADKVKWLQAMLLSLYYRDLLKRPIPINAVIDSIAPVQRANVVGAFAARFGATDRIGLVPIWRQMLNHWSVSADDPDDVAVLLRFTSFHILIEGMAAEITAPVEVADSAAPPPSGENGSISEAEHLSAVLASRMTHHTGFITGDDVRRIIDCASFLPQQYDALFNVSLTLRPNRISSGEEREQRAVIAGFFDELDRKIRDSAAGDFARITVIERDGAGLLAIAALHIPMGVNAGAIAEMVDWIHDWRRAGTRDEPVASAKMETAPARTKRTKFHWDAVLQLCAGMSDTIVERGEDGSRASLRRLLKIARRPDVKKVATGPLVETSGLLSAAAMAEACHNHLEPLSIVRGKAWSWLRRDWEADEYWSRRQTQIERAEEVKKLQLLGADEVAHRRLQESWNIPPEERERHWDGWWPHARAV